MAEKNDIDWRSLDPLVIDAILSARIRAYWEHVAANGGKEAKRAGCVIERIADIENLRLADKEAQSGKVKKNRYIRRHNEHAEQDLRELQLMILTLDFPPCEYDFMDVVSDAGKTRHIAKQKYHPWRILAHAIMQVIGPYLYGSFIHDTFACIKGKGIHFGVKRMKMMLRRYPEYTWFWKSDYKKYYLSIDHDVLLEALRRKFKDELFIRLMVIAVFTYESADDITEELYAEETKKERIAHRRLLQSAAGKFGSQCHRPPHEGRNAREMLPPLLR